MKLFGIVCALGMGVILSRFGGCFLPSRPVKCGGVLREEQALVVAFGSNGDKILLGTDLGKIGEIDVASGAFRKVGDIGACRHLAFLGDETLVQIDSDYRIKLWKIIAGRLTSITSPVLPAHGIHLGTSPDTMVLAIAGTDGKVHVWSRSDAQKDDILLVPDRLPPCSTIAVAPGGQAIGVVGNDRQIWVWQKSLKRAFSIRPQTYFYDLAFSPDGLSMAATNQDCSVEIVDLSSEKISSVYGKHGCNVVALAYSPNGKCLAAGSLDGRISLWDCELQKRVKTLEGQFGPVGKVCFSRDGKMLVSVDRAGSLKAWNLQDFSEQMSIEYLISKLSR